MNTLLSKFKILVVGVFSFHIPHSTFLVILFSFLLISCDEAEAPDIDDILSSDEQADTAGDALQIIDLTFSDDHKITEVSTRLLHDVGGWDLTDSTRVAVVVDQSIKRLISDFDTEEEPVVKKVTNSSRELFRKLDFKILALVDLSLPQKMVDAQCKAVKEIKAQFGSQSVLVAFMQGENVSETYEASDYVIDNYFIHQDPSTIYLYRSVLTKLAEIQDEQTEIGRAHRKVMFIMSGGKTYDGEQPIDPKHFELQQLLKDKALSCRGQLQAYYANISSVSDVDQELAILSDNVTDSNILQYFCKSLGGLYQSSLDWEEIEVDILKDFNIDLSNYKILLEQPSHKVFRGVHVLKIAFYDKATNDLIAKGQTEFSLGSVYNPVIIDDVPMIEFIAIAIVVTLSILLLVWLVLQFLEPYIRYRIFRHRYVIRYTGSNMSFQGQPVSQSCYLCKSPFAEGDEIVVRCKHTMHRECWDDNEYHCPEHGRHCKEGSHYYNPQHPLDRRNPLFYMKWVLVAIVAGFTSWCVFVSHDHPISAMLIEEMQMLFNGDNATRSEMEFDYGSGLNDLPAFGMAVGFVLTFFLANFTVRRRQWILRLAEVFIRAVVASLMGSLLCLLGCCISILLHFDYKSFLTEWIPWALLIGFIILAVTFKTRSSFRSSYILLVSCLIAVFTMVMWGLVYFSTYMDYRLSLLLAIIAYAVAIALCIARVTPRSERYFLHVEGAIKEMDVALYKWFRVSPNQVITIGRSVDCIIQQSWDINGHVAPLHAEIKRHIDSLRLKALEEGVTYDDGRPLPVGKEIWLYHGRSFTVGNTKFTYIEKDL